MIVMETQQEILFVRSSATIPDLKALDAYVC